MVEQYPQYKKHSLSKFLSEYPLGKPFTAVENYIRQSHAYTNPFDIKGSTFTFFCEQEQENKTFELVLTEPNSEYFGRMPGDRIPSDLFDKDGKLNFKHYFIGECKSCGEYHVDFLLHVYTDKAIPSDQSNTVAFLDNNTQVAADSLTHNRANIFIEKLGAPAIKIEIPKTIEKYLGRESGNWYYKAKLSLKENLGIGAFAYFRRIIEKELTRFVDDIIALPSADLELKNIVKKHRNSSKPHLIYEDIFPYLPNSLRVLDDNPLKLLYQQTSEGLHNLTETECMQRAKEIEVVLNFVMTKINEEKSTMLEVRNAMKLLRKSESNI
jgi:hypothetical protein